MTVLAGQTATVSFNNVLRRGDLTVTKTSEDGLVEGVKFHLYGTSVSGLAVDEFAVTNSKGVATFKDVLIGSGYTLEEVDTAHRYCSKMRERYSLYRRGQLRRYLQNQNIPCRKLCYLRIRYSGILKKDGCSIE